MGRTEACASIGMEDSEASLQSYRQRIEALERDRERIQRDLHDGILQTLYSVGLGLAAAKSLMASGSPEAVGQIDRAAARLDGAIQEIRGFLNADLGARVEDGEVLESAIRRLTTNLLGTSPVRCRLFIDPWAAGSIRKEDRPQILYIIREAISNALRHGQADAISVSLTIDARGAMTLQVEDNGVGFDCRHPRRRHGLHNLTARAQLMGGQLRLSSSPGHGTRLILELNGGNECLAKR